MLFDLKKEYGNAIIYFKKALVLADSVGDQSWKNSTLLNMAEAYHSMGDDNTALPIYEERLKAGMASKDPLSIAISNTGIGRVMIRKGQIKEGIKHLVTGFGIMRENKMYETECETAEELSDAYEKLHDETHALEYYKIYHALGDTIFHQKNDKRIQQLQFDYQLEKKQSQIELLKKNETIAHGKLIVQKVIMLGMVSGLVSLIVILVLLYRSRQHEKHNKEMIFRQKEEIEQQALKLEELNEFKDKTFSVLSHDLRGPLAAFTIIMQMLDENMISQKEFNNLKPEVEKQLVSLNILLDNLLKWSKSYITGERAIDPVALPLYRIAQQNIDLVTNVAGKKQITLLNNIPGAISAAGDRGQVDIIFRNLINNAIKFTNEGGTISLSANTDDDHVYITVADNGVGMTSEQLNKLFTPAAGGSTYGTNGERGIGLGLLLCYEFIKANNGSISATSTPGKGSIFTVTLPKNISHPIHKREDMMVNL